VVFSHFLLYFVLFRWHANFEARDWPSIKGCCQLLENKKIISLKHFFAELLLAPSKFPLGLLYNVELFANGRLESSPNGIMKIVFLAT
jgi:hypothetical protein